MCSLRILFLVFNLHYAFCLKVMCADEDIECFRKAIKTQAYPMFVAGISGVVDTSDPLRIDTITSDLPNAKYLLRNASMVGLKDCHFEKINISRINTKDTSFQYEMLCPRLSIESEYETNGQINRIPAKGKGPCTIEYSDYYLKISGAHERVKDESGEVHVNILNYELIPELRGTVKYNYKDLTFADKSQADEYTRQFEEITRNPVINVFMKEYMDHLKIFLKNVPTKNLHFKTIR